MTASDAHTFAQAFNRLRRRFNLPPDDEQAADYFAYLSASLSLDEMLRAMQALWATREFFPKPADFVLVYAAGEWRAVQACMTEWDEGKQWRGSLVLWPALSSRARAACLALGGVPAMKLQTDQIRLKASWDKEYALAVQDEVLALPVWTDGKALPAGRRQLGSGKPSIGPGDT